MELKDLAERFDSSLGQLGAELREGMRADLQPLSDRMGSMEKGLSHLETRFDSWETVEGERVKHAQEVDAERASHASTRDAQRDNQISELKTQLETERKDRERGQKSLADTIARTREKLYWLVGVCSLVGTLVVILVRKL